MVDELVAKAGIPDSMMKLVMVLTSDGWDDENPRPLLGFCDVTL